MNTDKTLCNKKNTCILVVTYNPTKDFSKNARQYLNIVDNVVVVDNGSNIDIAALLPPDIIQHFHIIRSEKNNGIAWALNRGIEWGIDKGFLYVLTFDQDSYPSDEILKCYSVILKNNNHVGLIGTSYSHISFGNYSTDTVEKMTVITSGLLHPVSTIKNVGLYKENMFIDSVDFDYSLRVKKYRYKVLRTKSQYIIHHLGNPIKRFGIISSNHAPVRRYYMARNHIYITKKYGLIFPLFVLKKNFTFLMSIIRMLLIEDNKYAKFKITMKGIADGFNFK